MDIADFIPTSKLYYVSILVYIFRTRDGLANKNVLVGTSKILSNVIVCIEWNNVIQFCLPFFLYSVSNQNSIQIQYNKRRLVVLN